MGKVVGLDGKPLGEPERTEPKVAVDTPEGQWLIPVVVLMGGQYDTLKKEIAGDILAEVLPLLHELLDLKPEEAAPVEGQLEMPLSVDGPA